MKSAMEEHKFTIELHGLKCKADTFAYSYHGSDTVYMRDAYFNASNTGYG